MASSTGDRQHAGHKLWMTVFNDDQRGRLLDEDYRTATKIGVMLGGILVVGLITAVVAILWTSFY